MLKAVAPHLSREKLPVGYGEYADEEARALSLGAYVIHPATLCNLDRAGYPVAGLYGRSIPDLFANIGNDTTDLAGGHAERTFKLPDYDGLPD